MASLLGTLRFATLTLQDFDATGTTGTFRTMTAAESKDGSDASYHGFQGFDDGGPSQGETHGFGSLDAAAPAGTIEFLRVKLRAYGFTALGPGPSSQNLYLRKGSASAIVASIATGSFADFQADIATNPATGLAWTAADLAASDIGYIMYGQTSDPGFGSIFQMAVSEFAIEVWGSTSAPAVAAARWSSVIFPATGRAEIDKATATAVVDKATGSCVLEEV